MSLSVKEGVKMKPNNSQRISDILKLQITVLGLENEKFCVEVYEILDKEIEGVFHE